MVTVSGSSPCLTRLPVPVAVCSLQVVHLMSLTMSVSSTQEICRVAGLITAGLMQSITPGCLAVGTKSIGSGSTWIAVAVV